MRFSDAVALGGTRKTDDGFLVAEAFAVRTGIQHYRGAEVGLADRDVVRVYRPEDEVRAPDSLRTFSHAPITLGHPTAVTADNWASLAKGEVSTEATWDGNKIKLPLIVKDQSAIGAIEDGSHRELSAGYTCQLDWTSGEAPDGQRYDAVQRNIRVNHLALVPRGRAGSECRIGDGAQNWGAMPLTPTADGKETPMSDSTKVVVLGDSAVTVSLDSATIIEAFKAGSEKAMADVLADHKVQVSAKDKELAAKDAKIADLEGKVLTDAQIDARAASRSKLLADVAKVAKIEAAGLSDTEVRKAAVAAKLGDAAVADRSADYIEARFETLIEAADSTDPLRDALKTEPTAKVTSLDEVYTQRDASLADAWKSEVK